MSTFTKRISIFTTLAMMGVTTTSFALTAAEYAIISDIGNTIAAHPESTATNHSQCNQLPITKSTLNKKSLNPACNLCLGETNTAYAIFPVSYTTIFSNDPAIPGDTILSVCQNNTFSTDNFVPFTSQFDSDAKNVCETRGGVYGDIGGIVALCAYITTN